MTTKLRPEDILSQYKLKNTACRKMILNELIKSETAMTEQEIKENSEDIFDRVTLYRTLRTLEHAGIIHSIVLSNNVVKYALTKFDADKVHSHFHCTRCNDVECLHDAVEVKTNLPAGYILHDLDIVVNGICNNCN
ncbi:MAG: transcriptional repressor [Porphyromonadaceae bacterium]|jgi:Fur family ferric uptake transcriptional regulator|nr:transcriptional repressor [Porphyromonadaceae bacterium]